MNMPQRADELQLWDAVDAGERARDAGARLGIPPRRVVYLCHKWTAQGKFDWGVSPDTGWPVRPLQLRPEPPVHACPPLGEGRTPCCRRTPFELPLGDRITLDPGLVTCAGHP